MHALKGAAGTLGAHRVEAIATELDRRIRSHDLGGIGDRIDDLQVALRSVAASVRQLETTVRATADAGSAAGDDRPTTR